MLFFLSKLIPKFKLINSYKNTLNLFEIVTDLKILSTFFKKQAHDYEENYPYSLSIILFLKRIMNDGTDFKPN